MYLTSLDLWGEFNEWVFVKSLNNAWPTAWTLAPGMLYFGGNTITSSNEAINHYVSFCSPVQGSKMFLQEVVSLNSFQIWSQWIEDTRAKVCHPFLRRGSLLVILQAQRSKAVTDGLEVLVPDSELLWEICSVLGFLSSFSSNARSWCSINIWEVNEQKRWVRHRIAFGLFIIQWSSQGLGS